MNHEFDGLLTTTQVKEIFHFTNTMLKHITPAKTYMRYGNMYPIKLYRLTDILEFRESPLGMALMAAAEERRRRFWSGVRNSIVQCDSTDLQEAAQSGRLVNIDELIKKHLEEKAKEEQQDAK